MIEINYFKEPTLIIQAPTGILYGNQVNGCSCEFKTIEGCILPVTLDHEYYFNPSWWYYQYGYTKGVSKIYNQIQDVLKNHDYSTMNIADLMLLIDRNLRYGSANGNNQDLKSWDEWKHFVEFIEEECEHIDLEVKQTSRQVEAWIQVCTKHGDGILTWENCD